jgi:cell division protein FtsZ
MTLNLTIPQTLHTDFSPRITVIGVGGGGTNAVDNMISMNLQGVEFVVANTDAQQLSHSRADRRVQLGPHITQGLGAGAKPEIGRAAAEEAAEEIYRHLDGAHMVFITAGMGGGTGTGAAPVIARMARERNILTVGVVTKPFTFEGTRRARSAESGIEELQQYVDTLIVIPNQNLFRRANERTGWKEAFKMADEVLYMGVRGVTDLMMAPGLVNLDFADIRTVMAEMGKAMMGTGEAEGENRAIRAAELAISNPLLEDNNMSGARGLLINITGGEDMTLFEVDQAANRIREEVDEEANIIFGSAIDDNLAGKVRVSVVATGIDTPAMKAGERPRLVAVPGGAAAAGEHATHAVGQQQPAVAAATPATVGNLALAQQPSLHPASSAMLRPAAPQPLGRPPQPGARPPAGYTLQSPAQPATSRFASPPPAAPAQELDSGSYDSPAYAEPQPRPQPAPRPPLQQRLAARASEPRIPGRSATLFADPPPAAPPPAPPRPSLFGRVTGAFRGQAAEPPPAAKPHAQASNRPEQPAPESAGEPARPSVRQTVGEDAAVDIPAFLRRQSS